jgi:glycosyltransferase involved in cell wall biosynthesis
MPETERSVLHVLPHPGGGGETYVHALEGMPGYRFSRVHLARDPRPSVVQLARGVARTYRHAWGHDLLHVHGEVAAALFLPLLAARPSVVTLHGLHLVRRVRGPRKRGAALSLRAVLRAADRTICVGQAEHDVLANVVGRAAARRAAVVRNGVRRSAGASGAERADVRRKLGVAYSDPLAIWVGSLDERKDPLTAVRAAERAEVALLVVGDGPLRAQVEQSAEGHAHVLGRRDDVPRLLASSDVFVSTAAREGLAFSLLEAMAAGLPSVVSELPENLEAIGDAGVAYSGEQDLVAALRRLADEPDERAALGERARHRVAELFSADEMIGRTRSCYDDVLRQHR